ncbi:hypothetical protein NL329_29895, partial [Klebsiella pneumoniae]|nr:hypothetical protein [Klebsiella pneumoniae]
GHYIAIKTSRIALFLTVLSCIGQITFTFGVSLNFFYIMLIGRFIYGIGGECFLVMQNKRITNYFRDKELAISLAVLISMGRFGTICNFIVS